MLIYTIGINKKNKIIVLVATIAFCAAIVVSPFYGDRFAGFIATTQPQPSVAAPVQMETAIKEQTPKIEVITKKTPAKAETDPVVNCKTNHLGSFQLKQSDCSKISECQIGGNWYLATSEQECKSSQELYAAATQKYQTSGGYVPPLNLAPPPSIQPYTIKPLPSFAPIPVYFSCNDSDCMPDNAPSVPFGFGN